MQKRQRRQPKRLNQGQGLGNDEYAMPIQAVDPDTGEGREDKGRHLSGKTDEAEQHRRTGEPVDQPTGGYTGHPGADQRNALAAEEELVVAMAERAQRMCHPRRQWGFHFQWFIPLKEKAETMRPLHLRANSHFRFEPGAAIAGP